MESWFHYFPIHYYALLHIFLLSSFNLIWSHVFIYVALVNMLWVIVLYFSILLHCIVQWVLQVMFPSACSFIVLVFTVFGLHGHIQVCRICLLIRILQAYENKISYTLEDGHVGRNMWKTVKTNTIKLHADGNITCKTHVVCCAVIEVSCYYETQRGRRLPPLSWIRKQIQFPKRCVF
jgi:hypothetical protein